MPYGKTGWGRKDIAFHPLLFKIISLSMFPRLSLLLLLAMPVAGKPVISEFMASNDSLPSFRTNPSDLEFPGGNNEINFTPTWTSPGNYHNVQIDGVQSANLTAITDSLDADLFGSQALYYLWFDFSSELGTIAPGDVIKSATMTWSGSADFLGFPLDETETTETLQSYRANEDLPYDLKAEIPMNRRKQAVEFLKRWIGAAELTLPTTVVNNNAGHVVWVGTGAPTVSQLRQLLDKE